MQRFATVAVCLSTSLLSVAARAQTPNGTVSLPTAFVDTTYPSQSSSVSVCNSGCTYNDLQTAVNAVQPGTTIMVDPSYTFSNGTLTLPAKPNTGAWVVIRSSSPMFDSGGAVPPGIRVNGSDSAQTAQMPKIRAGLTSTYAVNTQSGANHYRLVGLEISPDSGDSNGLSGVVHLGSESTTTNDATDIIFDRVYLHGYSGMSLRKGVIMNGGRMAVVDSHFTEIHDGTGDDNAIVAWNGSGPFKIANNRLEAAGEVIMFGGDDATVQSMSPADITVQGNVLNKKPEWHGVWAMKNLFELKDAFRVLAENNIMENTWYSGQHYAVVLTPRNQDGHCPWCAVQDVTIRNNIIRNAPDAVQILGTDNVQPSGIAGDILVSNNIFDNIDFTEFSGTGTPQTILLTGPAGPQWVDFENNTFINVTDSGSAIYLDVSVSNFVFRGNLMRLQTYGVFSSVASPGTATLNARAPGWIFEQNGLANGSTGNSSNHPTGNTYLDPTTWAAQFKTYNSGNNGDYHLVSGNRYGTNVGADVDAVLSSTACAETGTCQAASSTAVHWSFDEGTGTTVGDDSGNGNNGVVTGAAWTTGIINGALAFNGVSDNVQVASPSSALKPTGAFAISAWVKYTTTDTSGGEVASMGDSYALRVKPTGEVATFFYNGSTWITLTTAGAGTNNGAWHHLVGQYTGSALEVYVDGARIASAAASGPIAYTLGTGFFIGQNGNGDTSHNFNGTIDEVRVFTSPLSAADVTALATAPPAAYWAFAEGSGTTTVDSTGNGNTGTITGAIWTPTGRVGNALQFDGTDDSVQVASPAAALKPSGSYSISAWVKYSQVDTSGAEVASMGDSYGLRVRSTGEVNTFFYNGASFQTLTTSGAATNDNAWHHLVGQYDGSQLQIYVDGVLKAQTAASGTISYTRGTGFFIGHHGNGNSNYDFNGTIDQVRIFDRARTGQEISKLAAEGQ